jgi:hypothetical protein
MTRLVHDLLALVSLSGFVWMVGMVAYAVT